LLSHFARKIKQQQKSCLYKRKIKAEKIFSFHLHIIPSQDRNADISKKNQACNNGSILHLIVGTSEMLSSMPNF